jgi:hypothetical protein
MPRSLETLCVAREAFIRIRPNPPFSPYYLIIKEDPYKVYRVTFVFHYEKYCILWPGIRRSTQSV